MAVFLPLASSAGWFEGAGLHDALALRLKVMLLVEDELVVDTRAFRFYVTQTDTSEQFFPDGAVPWSREDPSVVGVTANDGVVEMKMDWRPLLTAAGIAQLPGVTLVDDAIAPSVKRALRSRVDDVLRDATVVGALPHPRVRDAIVKYWLLDCAGAAARRCGIAADAKASAFVDAMNVAVAAMLGRPSTSLAPRSFLLHDVRQWTWPAVANFRASSSGAKLRALLMDARRAHAAGEQTPTLQPSIDALTGRRFSDASILVVCAVSQPHALADTGTPPATVYVIGATGPTEQTVVAEPEADETAAPRVEAPPPPPEAPSEEAYDVPPQASPPQEAQAVPQPEPHASELPAPLLLDLPADEPVDEPEAEPDDGPLEEADADLVDDEPKRE